MADVSRAILNVTEGDKMVEIEKAWLGTTNQCSDTSTSVSSISLGIESFAGLFAIVGIAAALALFIFIGVFPYKHKDVWNLEPDASVWKKVAAMWRYFYFGDQSKQQDRSSTDNVVIGSNSPASHLSYSDDRGPNSGGSGEEESCRSSPSEITLGR